MPGLFHEYKIALLDASFFNAPFPDDVKEGLNAIKVYVPGTFRTEVEHFRIILSENKLANYDANLSFLQANKHLNTLDLNSFGEAAASLHNDVWGLIDLFNTVKPGARIIVVTADQLLIQRIVLHAKPIDLYDLNTYTFRKQDAFADLRAGFEFQTAPLPELPDPMERASDDTPLYRANGTNIRLGKVINSGLESNLYALNGTTRLVAKVFKKGRLTPKKLQALTQMAGINDTLEVTWALFPVDMLYFDPEAEHPAGFTERYAPKAFEISDNPLYSGQLDGLPPECLKTRLSDTIDLCIKVVRQVCYLNHFGLFISDFNTGNFAELENESRFVQMWDTDSFGHDSFFSGYCSGDKVTKDYDISTKTGAVDFCFEALYLFVFSLLSLGDSPVSEYTGRFKYSNPNYPFLYRSRLFPNQLWQLFSDIFTCKKFPSAEILLHRLSQTRAELESRPFSDYSYGELLRDILSR